MRRPPRRITQVFTPVDSPFPGFGGNFRIFQRFLRVFRLRFNLLWIEWFLTRSSHRCYPCLYGHEQNIGMVTSTLRVTLFNGFSVTQSRPRGKSSRLPVARSEAGAKRTILGRPENDAARRTHQRRSHADERRSNSQAH